MALAVGNFSRVEPLGSRAITSVALIIGMEIHVELSCASKAFASAPSPAAMHNDDPGDNRASDLAGMPNTLVDATVLGLPGSLPVLNVGAVEQSIVVGLALGCTIARRSVWDRKHYTYPDLPKGYQISQLAEPICGAGVLEVPALDSAGFPDSTKPRTRVRIARAHLEEDAGKLLHEAPGGEALSFSIADYNRAGTALLEIVSEPDMRSSDEALSYARTVRGICIALGATKGVMQQGHVRFEPNINCELTLSDASVVRTPIVEVKNLNSFRALRGAIEFELRDQPRRYAQTGIVHAKGSKTTRGWDDAHERTFVQREKEEAHDYRYMPDPDLPPLVVSEHWLQTLQARVPALPLQLYDKFQSLYGLAPKEAFALIDEPRDALRVEAIAAAACELGVANAKAGKLASTLVLQYERSREATQADGTQPAHEVVVLASIVAMRDAGEVSAQAGDKLLDAIAQDARSEQRTAHGQAEGQGQGQGQAQAQAHPPAFASVQAARDAVRARAHELGLLTVRDEAAMERWVHEAIAKHPQAAADVRAGKQQAIGRLVGEVVKLASGKADAAWAREKLLAALSDA
jgi:aspartyl-tRNA(Asn)/glutamyl-tRNA(Gln) amidotransferase subunit B